MWADALNRQTEYLGYKTKKERAILKIKEDSYIYNHKLVTISILENPT